MKKVSLFVLACFLFTNWVFADVITFDENQALDLTGQISEGYGGLNWDNFFIINESEIPELNSENGAVSGEWAATTEWGIISAVDDQVFDFTGAYLSGIEDDGLLVNVIGYKDFEEMYATSVVVNTEETKWFEFDFNQIDELVFWAEGSSPYNSWNFLMDNFTYQVPEPAIVTCIGISLLFLGGFRIIKRA